MSGVKNASAWGHRLRIDDVGMVAEKKPLEWERAREENFVF